MKIYLYTTQACINTFFLYDNRYFKDPDENFLFVYFVNEKMFLIKECKTYKKLLDRVPASNSLPTSVVSLAVIC
jgi:hypothetical protein